MRELLNIWLLIEGGTDSYGDSNGTMTILRDDPGNNTPEMKRLLPIGGKTTEFIANTWNEAHTKINNYLGFGPYNCIYPDIKYFLTDEGVIGEDQ